MSDNENEVLLKFIEQGFGGLQSDLKSNDGRLEKFEGYVHSELARLRDEDRSRVRDLHLKIDANQKETLSQIILLGKTLGEVQFFMAQTKEWMQATKTDIESIRAQLYLKAEKKEMEERIKPLESFQVRMSLLLTAVAAAAAFAWDALKEWFKT